MDERLALQSWQQNTLGAEGPSGSWEGVGRLVGPGVSGGEAARV